MRSTVKLSVSAGPEGGGRATLVLSSAWWRTSAVQLLDVDGAASCSRSRGFSRPPQINSSSRC